MASVGSILGDRWGITGQATVLASAAAIAATLVVVRSCPAFVAVPLIGVSWNALWVNTISPGSQIALNYLLLRGVCVGPVALPGVKLRILLCCFQRNVDAIELHAGGERHGIQHRVLE